MATTVSVSAFVDGVANSVTLPSIDTLILTRVLTQILMRKCQCLVGERKV